MAAFLTSIPVTVITGFLGSGKTTLLSALLKQPDMERTAVIINEFGKVGIDHCLIERREENIIELQNGCICCTIRGDLLITLKELVDKMASGKVPEFDRVIVETTGLADPVPIVHTLMTAPDLFRIYTLDGVVTVVDAVNGEEKLEKHVESMKQAAIADRLIISKTDIASPEILTRLTERLKSLNPAARIIYASHGNVEVHELFGLGTYDTYSKNRNVQNWLNHEAYLDKKEPDRHAKPHQHKHDLNRHNEDIEAFAMTYDKPVNFLAFSFFLQLMMGQVGPDMLRMKGIVNVEDRDAPAVIHGVQHVFHPVQWLDKWPDDDRRTRLVFITKNIPKENIEGLFDALMGLAEQRTTPEEAGKLWATI